jgi:hypothetical protein
MAHVEPLYPSLQKHMLLIPQAPPLRQACSPPLSHPVPYKKNRNHLAYYRKILNLKYRMLVQKIHLHIDNDH